VLFGAVGLGVYLYTKYGDKLKKKNTREKKGGIKK
jgi:hypothetical protein